MAALQDIDLARRVLHELGGEDEQLGGFSTPGRRDTQGRGPGAHNRTSGQTETRTQDFTAEEFFTAYGQAIEQRAEARVTWNRNVRPELRDVLVSLLAYFENPSPNVQAWPSDGLRALAMLAPLHVASNVLGVDATTLDYAISTRSAGNGAGRTGGRNWRWWRSLGADLLAGELNASELGLRYAVSPRTVRRYAHFLLGQPLGPKGSS